MNFGTPLNTEGDEHGLVVSTNGREAYFAGRRDGTKAMDIIRFQVPPEFKPEKVFSDNVPASTTPKTSTFSEFEGVSQK